MYVYIYIYIYIYNVDLSCPSGGPLRHPGREISERCTAILKTYVYGNLKISTCISRFNSDSEAGISSAGKSPTA